MDGETIENVAGVTGAADGTTDISAAVGSLKGVDTVAGTSAGLLLAEAGNPGTLKTPGSDGFIANAKLPIGRAGISFNAFSLAIVSSSTSTSSSAENPRFSLLGGIRGAGLAFREIRLENPCCFLPSSSPSSIASASTCFGFKAAAKGVGVIDTVVCDLFVKLKSVSVVEPEPASSEGGFVRKARDASPEIAISLAALFFLPT